MIYIKKYLYITFFILNIIFLFNINTFSKDDLNCSLCHNYKELKIIDSDGKEKSFYVNKDLFNNLVHKKLTCETCHYTIIQTPHPPDQLKRVSCSGKCHVNDVTVDRNFTHEPQFNAFQTSAHGDRVENPIGCACHGKHLLTKVKEFSTSELNRVCAHKCHEDKVQMYKYKLSPFTVQTYLDSYHGESIRFDEEKYPGCITCHGNHNVKIQEEKESSINPKNRLEKVCARKECHKTGFEKKVFSQGTYHQIYKRAEKPKKVFLEKLEKGYVYLIVFTAMLFIIFYVLKFISKIRRKKIIMTILIVVLFSIVIVAPFFMKTFISEKGVRFAYSTTTDRYKSICLECHSLYPHHNNIIMRAFMNLHSLKLACEVCHVRSLTEIKTVEMDFERQEILKRKRITKENILDIEEKPLVITRQERGIVYQWYKNGKDLSSLIRKMDGDEGSQLMIFKIKDNNELEILEAKRDTGLNPNFKISQIAVQCKDCHNKNGLMDFRALGYPEKMVLERLEKTRAFEMLQKSEKFLIPKLF